VVAVFVIAALARPALAHVGSPDVYFDGDAGPYHVSVTVRVPVVIPGVAEIEVRATPAVGGAGGVTAIDVVPMRLTRSCSPRACG
jgi:hypothetical protein